MRQSLIRIAFALALAWWPVMGSPAEMPVQGSPDDLLGQMRRALATYQGDPRLNAVLADLYLKLAQLYQQRGRIDEAIAADRKAGQLDPRNYVSTMHLISIYLDRQQYEAALVELDRARHFFASPIQYHLRRAEVLQALQRNPEATREVDEAMKLAPHDHRVKLAVARLHQERGQKQLAGGYLEAARTDAKADLGSLIEVAAAYREAGWPDVAEQILEEVRGLRPQDYRPYRQLGVLYNERGDWPRAEKVYLQALQLAPYLAEVHRELAGVYAHLQKDDTAVQHYRDAINLDTDEPQNYLALASFFRQRGRNAEGLEQIRTAIRIDPNSPIAYRHLGDYYREMGSFPQAAEAYQEAVTRDPDNADTIAHLGWLQLFLGNFRASESLLRQAMDRKPNLQRPRHTLVSAVFFQGRPQDALAMLTRYVRETPNAAELRSLRAYILYTLDRVQETYEESRRILQIQPGNPEYLIGLAEIAQELGEGARAESLLRRVLSGLEEPPPGSQVDPDLFLFRARAQAGLGQYPEALANLDKALELNHNPLSTVNLYRNRGYVLYLQGNYDGAIQTFRKGLDQSKPPFEPEFWETRFSLGYTLLQLGRPAEAETEFRSYLQRFPANVAAHDSLAQALLAAERFDEASQEIEKALKLNPDSPHSYLTLGMLQYRRGQYGEAANSFRKTLAIVPRHPAGHVGLGFCWMEMGRNTQAEWEFSQAIAVDVVPREPQARMGMALLRFLEGRTDQARRMYEEALAIAPPFRDRGYTERFIQLWLPARSKAAAAWRGLLGLQTAEL